MVIFFLSFTKRSSEIAYGTSHRYCMVEPNHKGRYSDNFPKGERERIYPFLSTGDRKVMLNVKILICLGEELDIHIVV